MYKYIGKGKFLMGVPARDLTDEEVSQLPKHLQLSVKSSGIYRKQKQRKEVKQNGD